MTSATVKTFSLSKFNSIIARYPVPFVCSLVLTLLLSAHETGLLELSRSDEDDLKIAFSTAFLASGAWNLFAYSRPFGYLKNHAIAGIIALVVISFELFSTIAQSSPFFLYPGLIMMLMVAGFLFKPREENAVWLFNSQYAVAIVMSIIVALIFGGGLNAISHSLDFLLGINIDRDVNQIIWITAIAFVGPVFDLYLMPQDTSKTLTLPDEEHLLSRGVMFLINYVLAPMIVVYFVILHLYALRMAFTVSLPKGQVAMMVLIFSLGVTGFVLIARPWVKRSTRFAAWLLNYWHFLLITPLALLAISVWRRISDYGITPERYLLVVLGAWLLAMLLLPLFRRRQVSSVTIIGSLAAILIAVSFGPWGAKSVSISSQKHELVSLLERNNLLSDGKLVSPIPHDVTFQDGDSRTGNSIIQFLGNYDALDTIRPLLSGHESDPFVALVTSNNTWKLRNEIIKLIGFNRPENLKNRSIHFEARKPQMLDITGYSYYFSGLTDGRGTSRNGDQVRIVNNQQTLSIQTPKGNWDANISEIQKAIEKANKGAGNNVDSQPISFELSSSSGIALMLIKRTNIHIRDSRIMSMYIEFDMLVK